MPTAARAGALKDGRRPPPQAARSVLERPEHDAPIKNGGRRTIALASHNGIYAWPGNVRELRNVVESMVLLALNDALTIEDLPPEFPGLTAAAASGPPSQALAPAPLPAAGRLADSEKVAIMAAIQAEEGNFTRAAGRLGIAKSTLYEKMKRYEIDRNTVADVGTA